MANRDVQDAIQRAQLIAAFQASFNPNPSGMQNHAEILWNALVYAGEGLECDFDEAQHKEFVNQAASIECQEMVFPLVRGLASSPHRNPPRPLLEGEVFVGQIELCYDRVAFQRLIYTLAGAILTDTPATVKEKVATQYQRVTDVLDRASSQAIFRPAHLSGKRRDALTFHRKADGVYVLLFKGIHLVFFALMPGFLQFIEFYPRHKDGFLEYCRMVAWLRKLYNAKIQPPPFVLP